MASQQRINRYIILSELDRGGMAVVYHAHDPNFDRDVAIKVLPRQFLHDKTFRARFQREAQAVARLEHTAIVPVYDFGEEDGQMYLVMRYMPDGSLTERLDEGPLPLAEAARILKRLAPALDKAHGMGIIHRDLKPANILFDRDGEAYITDFGIARLAAATSELTASSDIVGTPAYMSPEQARDSSDIDGRADIYSLGVIVYQMLTGKLPYQSNSPVGYLTAHATEPVPSILDANPNLPPVCQRLIERAMAKKPGDRYQTAADLAADLKSAARAGDVKETVRAARPDLAESRAPAPGDTRPAPPPFRTHNPMPAPPVAPLKPEHRTPRRRFVIAAWLAGALLAVTLVGVVLIELSPSEGRTASQATKTPSLLATLHANRTAAANSAPGGPTPAGSGSIYPTADLPDVPLSREGPWLIFLASVDAPELRYLWAVNADGTGLTRLTSDPILIHAVQPINTLEHGVKVAYVTRTSQEAAGYTLKMIALPGGEIETITPLLADTQNIETDNLGYAVTDGGLAWSTDGSALAFIGMLEGTTSDVYIYTLSTGEIARITDGPTHAYDLHWSPDGRYVVNRGFDFVGMGGTATVGMWAARVDGSGSVPLLEDPVDAESACSGHLETYGWSSPIEILFGCQYTMYSEPEGSIRRVNIETGETQYILAENFDSVAYAGEQDTWLAANFNSVIEVPLILIRNGERTEIPGKHISQVWWEERVGLFFGQTQGGKPYVISPQGEISEVPWDSRPQNIGGASSIEISPDGSLWVWRFGALLGVGSQLWIGQPMTAPALSPTPADLAIRGAAWSLDSQRLLLITDKGLWMATRPGFTTILIDEGLFAAAGWSWEAVWAP